MMKTAILLMLFSVPLLANKNTDSVPKATQPVEIQAQDSPTDLGYAPPAHVRTGRGLGDILLTIDVLPFGCDGPSGLSWDGQYLYVVGMLSDSVYVIDPTGPTLINVFPSPPTSSFGAGMEQNLWITCITTDSAYEYTTAGVLTGYGFPTDVTGASWAADGSEWWPDGEIWLVGVGSGCGNQIFKFSVPAGSVLDSLSDPLYTATSQRGISWDPWNEKFWLGGWNSDSVWEVDSDGTPTGRSFAMDGCAGIAYDWQSTLHPTPVLWICLQTPDQVIMVDADNPNPSQTIVWDFEDGWQGWIHTNGMSFPAAWERKEFDYKAAYAVPSAGDTSMWIDSDAISGTWVQDTALSPVIVPSASMDWLKYGAGYNDVGSGDFYEVGIKYYDGANWTAVPLVTYTADFYGMWDSVDVSAYAGYPLVQVYFYYDDADSWAWYAVFDNVSIDGRIAESDVGCNQITSPPAGNFIPAGNYDVIGNIKNFGDFTETFDATAEVWDTIAMALIFTQTVLLADFAPAAESLVTFGNVTIEEDRVYHTIVYTELADSNPNNDTADIYTNTMTFDFVWDFETGWQGWTHTNGLDFPEAWDVLEAQYIYPAWTPPDAGDSCMWIDSDSAYPPNVWVQDTALSPVIIPDASTLWLMWGVGYRHLGSQFMDVGVKYFDGTNWNAISLKHYDASFGPAWDSLDVSAYNAYDSLQIFFYFDDDFGWNWFASFDNVMINGMTGIAEEPGEENLAFFGFAPSMTTMSKHQMLISYSTTVPGRVSLKVYDATGRLVETLVDSHQPAAEKSFVWDSKDINNRTIANGIYFLRLEAEGQVDTHKMIFVR